MRVGTVVLWGSIAVMLFSYGLAEPIFPVRAVTLIVPFGAGGTTDVTMRALAAATEQHLGQRIVIENRSGASATLGPIHMAATAKADGYTIAQIPVPVFRAPFLTKTTFNPIKDLAYVIGISGYTFGVVVRNDAPWKNFKELLDNAKANPGRITYGSPGAGTILHITMEQIARQYAINWIHVPFKSTAESTSALLGGYVDAVADASGWAEFVNSGQLRLLVTWGSSRTKSWPSVPTLREMGIDIVSISPFGIAGPKGMEANTIKILHDSFKRGLSEPSYAAILAKFDMVPFYLSPEEYTNFAIRQVEEERLLVEEFGLRLE
jgi:tripartite-type tricarboxylate transporter receptor subunit TctC